MTNTPYEEDWNAYAQAWSGLHPQLDHIGDEWAGVGAGASRSLADYEALIEQNLIIPYLKNTDRVLEIGVGGGKTGALLLKHCDRLVCADVSQAMLQATEKRLGTDRVSYIKLDGKSLAPIPVQSVDVCFCYDTMVHMEPRDIFNYLTQIPLLLRGDRLCIFHHTNTLSPLGWQKFLSEWQHNIGARSGTAFSVMTDRLMAKFLEHLGYEVVHQDDRTVPRDCLWICRAPFVMMPQDI